MYFKISPLECKPYSFQSCFLLHLKVSLYENHVNASLHPLLQCLSGGLRYNHVHVCRAQGESF